MLFLGISGEFSLVLFNTSEFNELDRSRLYEVREKNFLLNTFDHHSNIKISTESIPNQPSDSSALHSLNMEAFNDNETTLALVNITQQFGFQLELPDKRYNYRTQPTVSFIIINETIVKNSNYNLSLSLFLNPEFAQNFSLEEENHADSSIMEINFEQFNPLDNTQIDSVNLQIRQFWQEFMEDSSILNISISSNQSSFQYNLSLIKDISPPKAILGFFWEENLNQTHRLIPFNLTNNIFNSPPVLSINMTDTVAGKVTISCIINNQFWSTSVNLIPYPDDYSSFFGQNLVNISLIDFFNNWDDIEDGNLTGILTISDNAGNMGDWILFSWVKDTVEPVLDSGIPDRYWLSIGDYALQDLEDPLFKTVELRERPQFNIQLKEADIKSVWLRIKWDGLPSYFSGPTASQNQNISSSNAPLSDEFVVYAQKNGTLWWIDFPEFLWEQIGSQRVEMSLNVQDLAGNVASYSFSIKKLTDNSQNSNWVAYIAISMAFSSFLIISAFVGASIHKSKHKSWIMEEENSKIDSDLLDLVLQPLDHFMLSKITDIIDKEGNDCKLSALLDPNEEEFLKEPAQLVDLHELKLLLNRYPMKTVDLEEFVREMLSLPPQERRSFLLEYMEELKNKNVSSPEMASIPNDLNFIEPTIIKTTEMPTIKDEFDKSNQFFEPNDIRAEDNIEEATVAEELEELDEIDEVINEIDILKEKIHNSINNQNEVSFKELAKKINKKDFVEDFNDKSELKKEEN